MIIKIENYEFDKINYDKILTHGLEKLKDKDIVILSNISCMPIKLELDNRTLSIILNDFATENDFEILKKVVENILGKDNIKYIELQNLDYSTILTNKLNTHINDNLVIEYIKRKVFLKKEDIKKILNQKNPITEFSKIVFNVQYINANQAQIRPYYDDNNNLIYIYYVNINSDTVMEYYSILDQTHPCYVNIIKKENDNIENINIIKYEEFITKLDKSCYKFIDSNNIVIKKNFILN